SSALSRSSGECTELSRAVDGAERDDAAFLPVGRNEGSARREPRTPAQNSIVSSDPGRQNASTGLVGVALGFSAPLPERSRLPSSRRSITAPVTRRPIPIGRKIALATNPPYAICPPTRKASRRRWSSRAPIGLGRFGSS